MALAENLEALRIDPAQPEVRIALAVMYQGSGHPDEAMEELRKALAIQPRNDNAHLVLGRILEDKGDWDKAVGECQAAVALRPTYWRNHAQLGDTLLRAGRLKEAIAVYERLIELQPDSARGYQRLGRALQASGSLDRALENYEKATAIRPSGATYSNMGTSYYWQGDYARAADAYRRAIVLAPNEADFYANLGDALVKLGRREGAREQYRRAVDEVGKLLAVKANDPLNLAALALYQAKLGDRAAADATIAHATAISPQDGEVLHVGAVVHALAGRSGAACETITAALAHGKSAEEVRRSDELKSLTRCPAYSRLLAGAGEGEGVKR
jgi:superkiller protein 3